MPRVRLPKLAGVLVKLVIAFAGELHEAEHAASTGDDGPTGPIDPADSKNCCTR